MGLRELFILVLGLAIVAVFLRGVYVAIKARKGQLRMQLDKNIPDYDPEELTLSELPNGGARLVERSFAQVVQQNSDLTKQEKKGYGSKSSKSIPVLMDSVDDDVTERTSTIASARQSARKKHVMGRSETVTSKLKAQPLIEPTETSSSNFDVPEDTAPTVLNVANDEYEHKLAPKQVEPDDDYDDDPIANHVFVDEAAETGELAPESYAVDDDEEEALDDNYFGYSEDDVDDEDESESFYGSGTREPDDTLENSSDYADEDILEHDEDAFEDEDFAGDGADALDNSRDQSADDLEDDDYEDEEEADHEIESEPFDRGYAEEPTEHKGFSALDDDSEFEDDEDETDLDYSDDAEDDQEYADDDPEQDDQFEDEDDEDEYDRDYDEPAAHEKEPSGPRSWLKWAGNKLSEMGGPSDEDEAIVRSERAEPVIGQSSFDEVMTPATRAKPQPRPEPAPKAAHFDKTHQSQLDLGMPAAEQPAPKPARERKRAETKPESAPKQKSESAVSTEFSEVLVINVMAKTDRDIAGIDMLQVLMANGLIFGEMSIFHRHLEHNRESPVLFSVANMVNPGTFDLNQIGEFSTKGLCFFLTLPNVATSMQAFEKMLEAAQQIRVALDCDLKDDSRSVMTAQTIEHYRQRVRDFDLRQLRQSK